MKILLGILYADDLELYSESDQKLSVMTTFCEMYKRRGLKANVDKSKVMVVLKYL